MEDSAGLFATTQRSRRCGGIVFFCKINLGIGVSLGSVVGKGLEVSVASGSEGTSPTAGMSVGSGSEGTSLACVSCGTGLVGGEISTDLAGSCAVRGGIVECRKGEIFLRNCLFLFVIVLEPSTLMI